jgi:hypothetical protein
MSPRFTRDFRALTEEQRAAARDAARQFAEDLNQRTRPRPALRVKRVQGAPPGVLEMTWAPDGRATFEFGREIRSGEHHVVWRRIGTHAIFGNP